MNVLLLNVANVKWWRAVPARLRYECASLGRRIVRDIGSTNKRRCSDFVLLGGELLLGLIVALVSFSVNRRNLLGYIDGQYLLTLMKNQSDFGTWTPVFSANPLQGLDDVWYFANTLWIPEFSLAHLFANPNTRAVIVQTVAFLEVMSAASLFAYWLHGSMGRAVASGWLAGLAIFPFSYPSLVYNVGPDAPQLAFLTVVPIAMVPLLAALGRGSVLRNAAISAAIVLLAWIHFIGIGLFVSLTYPFLAIAASAFLVTARQNRAEFIRKTLWYAIVAAVLVASGLPQILLGFSLDSAAQFFPKDLGRAESGLADGSLLFRRSEPFGVALAASGILGALISARYAVDRMRQCGLAVTILAGLICLAAIINALVGFRGAIPIYYEYVLWIIYPIFAVVLLTPLLTAAAVAAFAYAPVLPERTRRLAVRTAWLTLPLLALVILHGPHYLRDRSNGRPNVFPPRSTEITEFLRNEIGLSLGSPFRGRVATMTGYSDSDTSWIQAFTDDLGYIEEVGNEHRSIGLWYYNIPTLFEFSHTIRPRLYIVTKNLLARETDSQFRTVLNFRRPNLDVLRLLGVRYLVTDSPAPAEGMRRVRTMALLHGRSLAVDETQDANLGVSPIQIHVGTDREALRWLTQSAIDFETTAILPAQAIEPGGLTRATDVAMIGERGGFRVRAVTSGDSLIILPIQFSHCLRASANNGSTQPKVVRADFLLTGLYFHGVLDSLIEYRQGPFVGTSCGLEDLRDDRDAMQIKPALQ